MTRVLRWYLLAGVAAALLGLTVPASAATGWTIVTPSGLQAGIQNDLGGSFALPTPTLGRSARPVIQVRKPRSR